MLFNSVSFALFLPVVFFLYWFVVNKNLTRQNLMLLIASYFFYACWDWRFMFLLMFSTLLDYYTGLQMCISGTQKMRKFWLLLSVIINLGFLGLFKYYNFFAASFTDFLSVLGFTVHPTTIKLILPVGISFYTFHGLSYVIDIYYKKIKAERNIITYALFVSFFPLLVAGPIERATHLLPQIKQKRSFDYSKAVDGLRQILWGLFKKMVIADNCAMVTDIIFANHDEFSGSTLVLGALLFAFQIYGDFSGYSDIALGTARLLGISLLRNFAFPYFSRDIAEFWRRWHISLTTWFRDYLYIPLGGSRCGIGKQIRNTYIIFLVSGFWHGANWTFLMWGLLHATYFLPLLLTKRNRKNIEIVAFDRWLPTATDMLKMGGTFVLTVFAWIFFRAETIAHAFEYIARIPQNLTSVPEMLPRRIIFVILLFFIVVEWFGRRGQYALENIGCGWPKAVRWSFYYLIVVLIVLYAGISQEFIYFQF